MGGVTDGRYKGFAGYEMPSIKKYSYEEDNTLAYVQMGFQTVNSIFGMITQMSRCYAADPTKTSGGGGGKTTTTPPEKAPANVGLTAEDVGKILAKYDIDSTDGVIPNYTDITFRLQEDERKLAGFEQKYNKELEAYNTACTNLKTAQGYSTQFSKLDSDIAGKSSAIEQKTGEYSSLKAQFDKLPDDDPNKENLKNQLTTLRNEIGLNENGQPDNTKGLHKAKADLEAQKRTLLEKLQNETGEGGATFDAILGSLQGKVSAANIKEFEEYNKLKETVRTTKEDIAKLDQYYGQKPLENSTNDDTNNITALLRKYNNAKTPEEKASAEKELAGALVKYNTAHKKGENSRMDQIIDYFSKNNTAAWEAANPPKQPASTPTSQLDSDPNRRGRGKGLIDP